MANTSPSLSARIRALEAAKSRAAALPRKTRLSFEPMMELLAVSRPVLRGWCNEIEGFEQAGAFIRGGNGMEWDFDPRKTVAFLLRHFTGKLAAAQKSSDNFSKAINADTRGKPFESDVDAKFRINTTLIVVGAQERQSETCKVSDVEKLISSLFEAWVSGVMSIRTKMDPNGHLTPAQRTEVEDNLRLACAHASDEVEVALRTIRAGINKGRVGG